MQWIGITVNSHNHKKASKRPWSSDEKEAIYGSLYDFVVKGHVPTGCIALTAMANMLTSMSVRICANFGDYY